MKITEKDKIKVLNYLKNRLKSLSELVINLQKDLKSDDPDVQLFAITASDNLVKFAAQLLKDLTPKAEK